MAERKFGRVVVADADASAASAVRDYRLEAQRETARVSVADVWTTNSDGVFRDGPLEGEWKLAPDVHGTVWRVCEHRPANPADDITLGIHKTATVDYGIVLSGSITLVLEDASQVELNTGDCWVLRGTPHNWVNLSDEPCWVSVVNVDMTSAT